MAEEMLQSMFEQLSFKVNSVETAVRQQKDAVVLEKEVSALSAMQQNLNAKARELGLNQRWHPRLRPVQTAITELSSRVRQLKEQQLRKITTREPAAALSEDDRYGMGSGAGASTLQQQVEAPKERETIVIAKNMLRTVYETQDMSAEALIELGRQGEQIDRAHDNVRRVHESLDKAEEHITGMKSIFGGLINRFRTKPKAIKLDTDYDFPVQWEKKKKWGDRTMRFGTEEFSRIGKKGHLRKSVPYRDLNGILVTRYPTVFELSHGKNGREVCRAPQYKQVIALLLRKTPKAIPLVFEDGAEPFDPKAQVIPGYQSVFQRRGEQAEDSLLTATAVSPADEETVEGKLLDAVSLGLGDLKQHALAMGQELHRQRDKMDVFEVDLDIANSRMRKNTRAVRELM